MIRAADLVSHALADIARQARTRQAVPPGMDPRHALERFHADAQPIAWSGARALLDGRTRGLVIAGPPRSGRSHLAEGIAIRAAQSLESGAVVIYARAQDIARDLDRAWSTRSEWALRERLSAASLLVVDDVDQVYRMPATTRLIADMLRIIERDGGRWCVVLRAGPRAPDALRSVLLGGLIARTHAYTRDDMLAILRARGARLDDESRARLERIADRARDVVEALAMARAMTMGDER